jgi:hypothetical protein
MSTAGGAAKCLVVVELGASCPAFVSDMRSDCWVHQQQAEESATEFAERIVESVRGLGASARVALAVLVCSDQAVPSPAARKRCGLGIADLLARSGEGELLLMANPGAGDQLRQELFELAETLCERLVGTAVGVRVRFSELQSGIASARPVAPDPALDNGSQGR